MTLTWLAGTSPSDNVAQPWRFAYSPTLGRIAAGIGTAGGLPEAIITSDDNGATWTARTTPFDGSGAFDVAWSETEQIFVAVGYTGTDTIMSSPDGITWTARGDPFSGIGNVIGNCVTRNDGQGLFVAGGLLLGAGKVIATSPNGIVWTGRTSPWDSLVSRHVNGVAYSDAHGKWIAVGKSSSHSAMTSPTGVTWTQMTSGPFDSLTGGADVVIAADGTVVAGGQTSTQSISVSVDLATWTPVANPLDSGGYVSVLAVSPTSGLILAGGFTAGAADERVMSSADNGTTWTLETTPFDGGNDPRGVGFAGDDTAVATGYGGVEFGSVTTAYASPPAPPIEYQRIYGVTLTITDNGVEQPTLLMSAQ